MALFILNGLWRLGPLPSLTALVPLYRIPLSGPGVCGWMCGGVWAKPISLDDVSRSGKFRISTTLVIQVQGPNTHPVG